MISNLPGSFECCRGDTSKPGNQNCPWQAVRHDGPLYRFRPVLLRQQSGDGLGGWDPETGIDAALSLLGWTCQRSHGTEPTMALQNLGAALAGGPVLVGPVEMGLLRYHPDAAGAIGAD